jgi:hypothetical protein
MNATIATQQYRVIATTTTGFVDPRVDTTVKWQGTDTDELSRLYPPSDIFGADELFQKEIEGGFIITRFCFEKQLEDGSWQEIDDPRRRLTPVTELERAIDAENRRDFPGDYITDDEDEYDDYQVSCTNCQDHGCELCEPVFCTNCNDHGCAECQPDDVCKKCNQYLPGDVFGGICYGCGRCHDCGIALPDDAEGNLCATCSMPKCIADCNTPVDNDGEMCGGCEQYYASLDESYCTWCQSAPKTVGDLCKPCNKSIVEMEREHMRYIGFLWRSYYWLCYRSIRLWKRFTKSS